MQRREGLQKVALVAVITTSALVLLAGTIWGVRLLTIKLVQNQSQASAQSGPPVLLGFPISSGQLAPDFTLTDQFGHTVTLSSLRGHEVVLAFIDSQCITLCPLTAQIMYNAKMRLSPSEASQVDLVAVNANPDATSRAAVLAWSYEHGMLNRWEFLTGPAQQLETIYHQYNVYTEVESNGTVVHNPITYIIDAQGHERLYFETLDSSAKADLLSQEIGMEYGMKQWLPTQ
jgi:cytochrome oxidase Cu insertion factor (SCO1/SenC/PrrC family)